MFKIFESGCHLFHWSGSYRTHLPRSGLHTHLITTNAVIRAVIPQPRAQCSNLWVSPGASCWYPMDSGHSTQCEPRRGEKADHSASSSDHAIRVGRYQAPWTWNPWNLEAVTLAFQFGDIFQTAGMTPYFEKLRLPALILTAGLWPPAALTTGASGLNFVPDLITCPAVSWSLW